MYIYTATNGREYKLCKAYVTLRDGSEAAIHYFIGPDMRPKKGSVYADSVPNGFQIKEAPKSGHPLVVKLRN